MNIDARLAEQNNGQTWRDCNTAGLAHRWVEEQRIDGATYYRCTRTSCPVRVRETGERRPRPVLGRQT